MLAYPSRTVAHMWPTPSCKSHKAAYQSPVDPFYMGETTRQALLRPGAAFTPRHTKQTGSSRIFLRLLEYRLHRNKFPGFLSLLSFQEVFRSSEIRSCPPLHLAKLSGCKFPRAGTDFSIPVPLRVCCGESFSLSSQ